MTTLSEFAPHPVAEVPGLGWLPVVLDVRPVPEYAGGYIRARCPSLSTT